MKRRHTIVKVTAGLVIVIAVGGCGGHAATHKADTPTASAVAHPARPSSPPSASPGLETRSAIVECAAQIEVGTASGHDYSKDQPHSTDLPEPCRPLGLSQLITAVSRALADMRNG